MRELTEWFTSTRFPDKPWLVFGKGPTFARRNEFDLTSYNTVSLNHAVLEQKVDIAHLIDMDVVEACGEALLENCSWVLMPRAPHVQFAPSLRPLEEFFDRLPVLRRLDELGRLVWYNASTGPATDGSPVVDVVYFSSEAVLGILGLMGVKHVRSLGIDGGRGYSSAFSSLSSTTLLANTQPSFDVQFTALHQITRRFGMDYRALIEPIRVFVGVDESQLVAAGVLAWSLRAHASEPVRVVPITGIEVPPVRHKRNRPRTKFSFSRFAIPELAGHHGRAIYLDADMLVFGDIAELHALPFDGASVLCTVQPEPPEVWRHHPGFQPGRQMSVLLLDCDRLDWDVTDIVRRLDAGEFTYEQLMFDLCVVAPREIGDGIPPAWNHLERYEPGITKLLHYTVVPTQPWKSESNPLGRLWIDALRAAVAEGSVTEELIERGIRQGHLRASLIDDLAGVTAPASSGSLVATELLLTRERLRELEEVNRGLRYFVARRAIPKALKLMRARRVGL